MIVRLMGEGQYRIDDSLLSQLNELDDRPRPQWTPRTSPRWTTSLDEMWQLVRDGGEPLSDDELLPPTSMIPPSDLTLEETRKPSPTKD